jgi:hypothetical protein
MIPVSARIVLEGKGSLNVYKETGQIIQNTIRQISQKQPG